MYQPLIKFHPHPAIFTQVLAIFARIFKITIIMSFRKIIILLACNIMVLSCSVNKFIPEGEHLLDDVVIVSNTNKTNAAKARSYVRQQPTSKWFSLAKVVCFVHIKVVDNIYGVLCSSCVDFHNHHPFAEKYP